MTEDPMIHEDRLLASRIRAAFEDGAGLDATRLRVLTAAAEHAVRIRRFTHRACCWGSAALVAASVALALCFRALTPTLATMQPLSPEKGDGLDAAIGLLCELDGVSDAELTKKSAGELLLAWQDAPCADIL